MRIFENEQYLEDVRNTAGLELSWEKLQDRSVLISGATGLAGSFLTDVLLERNKTYSMNCRIYALGRRKEKALKRFAYCGEDSFFRFISHDIREPLTGLGIKKMDYVLHLASNTHPLAYAKDPIGTITTNIIGLKNMLDYAAGHDARRVVFASSNEIYGENRGDTELFQEEDCGYINCNTLRAGYPESKRCGEALCQAYMEQKELDVVIPRLTRSYGPTMQPDDSKAVSQFIKRGVCGEDVILKSAGEQYYSYTYVSDAVSGLLTVLLHGERGRAYNIADEASDIRLKDLAALIAQAAHVKVIAAPPDETEKKGYSAATRARLDGRELKKLGWSARYDIESGVKRTLSILRSLEYADSGSGVCR